MYLEGEVRYTNERSQTAMGSTHGSGQVGEKFRSLNLAGERRQGKEEGSPWPGMPSK